MDTFTIDDEVVVVPGTVGAEPFDGLTGRVVALEPATRYSVVVRFPSGRISGRRDLGWLFDPATLSHAGSEAQAA